MGYTLPGQIIAYQNAAAVPIALQALLIELRVKLPVGGICTEEPRGLAQDAHPGVGVVGAVVAVDHGHRGSGGGSHQVDLLMDLLQGLFQHDHGEDGGSG